MNDNYKFIKCRRGCAVMLHAAYAAVASRNSDIIELVDDRDVYLKLRSENIFNFKLDTSKENIIAEVDTTVGKFSLPRGEASTPIPIILIPLSDIDNLNAFGELIGINEFSSVILKDVVKD